MKKRISLVVLLVILFAFSGCANIRTPYDTDLDRTVLGEKVGESSWQSILLLVAWGNAGTAAAAKNGNITEINHMDQHTLAILWGLYYKHTTIVYGN